MRLAVCTVISLGFAGVSASALREFQEMHPRKYAGFLSLGVVIWPSFLTVFDAIVLHQEQSPNVGDGYKAHPPKYDGMHVTGTSICFGC